MKLRTLIHGMDFATKLLKKEYLPSNINRIIADFENQRVIKNRVVYRLSMREVETFIAIMSKLTKEQFLFNLPSKSYVKDSYDFVSYENVDFTYRIIAPNNNELYTLIDYEKVMYINYRGIHIYISLKTYKDNELYFIKCNGPNVKKIMPRIMKYVEKAEEIKCRVGVSIKVMLSNGKRISNTVSYTPLNQLIINDDMYNKLYAISKRYIAAYYARKFTSFGILLSGPSGSGKTTIVKALAKECNLSIITVPSEVLLSREFSLSTISEMGTSLILIEEIDRIFVDPDDENIDSKLRYQCESAIATLMQLLDGTLTPRNSIFILTTNYPELINRPELVRESRIDERMVINYFSEEMATKYLISQNILEEDIPQLLEESKLTDTEKELYHVENETVYIYPPSKISLNVSKYKRA